MHARLGPLRVLVVEDDVSDARILAQLLREDGYDVEVVVDGAAAIGRLARAPGPEVLLVDYNLPHADGLAVASFARSRDPGVEVMVLTGYPEIVARVGDHPGAVRAVFTKPLAYADLTRALAGVRSARDARAAAAGA
jgi:two-component system response regulator MprA